VYPRTLAGRQVERRFAAVYLDGAVSEASGSDFGDMDEVL
jgi:hypothetical protein